MLDAGCGMPDIILTHGWVEFVIPPETGHNQSGIANAALRLPAGVSD